MSPLNVRCQSPLHCIFSFPHCCSTLAPTFAPVLSQHRHRLHGLPLLHIIATDSSMSIVHQRSSRSRVHTSLLLASAPHHNTCLLQAPHLLSTRAFVFSCLFHMTSLGFKPEFSVKIQSSGVNTDNKTMQLTITQPDDWHLHLRDENHLCSVVPHSASVFKRAIIMPNLKPPVTTVAAALAYRERIMRALPPTSPFVPLMTLYLTDNTTTEEIKLARKSGAVFAVKLYPAGATTNSQAGVTDLFGKCMPVLEEMLQQGLPLLVHGEVTDKTVDIFDRESAFINKILQPLVNKLPQLKIVMEHITTHEAVQFVKSCSEGLVAATVTPQHIVMNRNALFQDGLQPHNYCLPVLKREFHRNAVFTAATSGSKQFFLGTDSAPHERHTKEAPCGCAGIYNAPVALPLYAQAFEQAGALDKLEAFASFNGPDFYGLPRNTSKITLTKRPWTVPEEFNFGSSTVIPMFAGKRLDWTVV